MSPSRNIRSRWRQLKQELLDEHTSPERLAVAAGLGILIGCTPLFGLHWLLCLGLATLFRLNKLTVYATANVSVPPLVPLLGSTSVLLGSRLRHGRWLDLSADDFRAATLHRLAATFFVDWLAGGLVLGAMGGLVIGMAVYAFARWRLHHAARPHVRLLAQASACYRGLPRGLRLYAWFKYRLDPVYLHVAARVPAGSLTVDLGTGMGMLPIILALVPGGRRTLGIEWDPRKVAAARHACAALAEADITITDGDVRDVPLPPCDVITVIDVLHCLTPDEQRALLIRATAALVPGGQLIIRDGDTARGGGARATRWIERWAVRLGWNRSATPPMFFNAAMLNETLSGLGFAVHTAPLAGRLHPGNVVFCATFSRPDGFTASDDNVTLLVP